MTHAKDDGWPKAKCSYFADREGKMKRVVALARKMLEL